MRKEKTYIHSPYLDLPSLLTMRFPIWTRDLAHKLSTPLYAPFTHSPTFHHPQALRLLRNIIIRSVSGPQARTFGMLHPRHYDGVYQELKALKQQKPWLQALRERDEAAAAATATAAAGGSVSPRPSSDACPPVGELKSKKMKESYHEIVGFFFFFLFSFLRRREEVNGDGS